MEPALETPADTAERPAVAVVGEPAPAAGPAVHTSTAQRRRLPEWWHSDHPVFVPLAGFFTGMVYVIVVPGAYAAILKGLVGYERSQELFPFVLLTLVVPIGLLAPPRTRGFGRYMLFGVLATAAVVIGVAVLVLYILIRRDS